MEITDFKQIKFFEKYTVEQLQKLASISTVKEFKVKEIIFEQYDELTEIYVLLQGSLVTWHQPSEG